MSFCCVLRQSIYLHTVWAQKGRKAPKDMLHICRCKLDYICHALSYGGKSITHHRLQNLLNLPRTVTKTHLRSFLGLACYCRQGVPHFSEIVTLRYDLTKSLVTGPFPEPSILTGLSWCISSPVSPSSLCLHNHFSIFREEMSLWCSD